MADEEKTSPSENDEEKTSPTKNNEEKVTPSKDIEEDKDFKYIIRVVGTDIDGEKPAFVALTDINGVGVRIAEILIDNIGYPRAKKLGHMSDEDVEKLENLIENIDEIIPPWLLNRRKDWDTGEDLHINGPELQAFVRDDINRMRMIRCYRGIRHEQGKKVRGQRTRSNGRTGLTLGVSRKRP